MQDFDPKLSCYMYMYREIVCTTTCRVSPSAEPGADVLHAGSGLALSLVLNIEQYQYMKGPQDEAGIKLLLHDASEVPLVKELGFAIAPGTHTLVAVNRNVVSLVV